MLYSWTGKPYRSKQRDVAPIIVEETCRVWIHHDKDGGIYYSRGQLWVTEGFDSPEDMAEWFRAVVPCGQDVPKRLMRFRLANRQGHQSHPMKDTDMKNDIEEPKDSIEAQTPGGVGLGEPAGYACVYVPQWQEKLGWKLFPNSYTEMPGIPKMKDCLVCYVTVHLSWLDRLRMLISGKLEVTAKTTTENVIGENFTNTGVSVRPPAWLDRHNDQGGQPRSG